MLSALSRMLLLLGVVALPTRNVPLDESDDETPVTVRVVGTGEIRLVVADGASLPCDGSGNHLLFDGHAKAGETVEITSVTGSVCVDHTYGEMRESQWAGGTLWSSLGLPGTQSTGIRGKVSTEEP